MKGIKVKELLERDPAEINGTLRKVTEDLFKNRLRKSTNQLENVMLIRGARREIARLKTVLSAQARRDSAGGKSAKGVSTKAEAT